jgi:hypothetical protein
MNEKPAREFQGKFESRKAQAGDRSLIIWMTNRSTSRFGISPILRRYDEAAKAQTALQNSSI